MNIRSILLLLLTGLFPWLSCGPAHAEDSPLVFAINEGMSYRANPAPAASRFHELATDLTRLLKRPVQVQAVSGYKELAGGLAGQRYDIAYVHPAHHAIRAMTHNSYSLIAVTKGFTDYRASFLVRGDSPLKTLVDLVGHKIGAPDEDSVTSVIMRATLRDALGAQPLPEIHYVGLQDAVPLMVRRGTVTAGVTASRMVARDWLDHGGRVLVTSRPVPVKLLLASARLSEAQRLQLGSYFLGLEQDSEGKKRLASLNVPGFVTVDPSTLLNLGKWLGI